MQKNTLKNLIDTAAGRKEADLVIKNCKIVDVFTGKIIEGEIAVTDGKIAGCGTAVYEGKTVIDAKGQYACPGLIDAHIHIESSYVSPEEGGRLLTVHGTTTIVADPHEIANVCGIEGIRYMIEAAKNTKLNILYAMPSCVPATPFEDAGAILEAEDMKELIDDPNLFGLGEFMNAPGIIGADEKVLDKLILAINHGKLTDGHAPLVTGKELNAYSCVGIVGDHECTTLEEMEERISKGMYVLMREGSACHNLRTLLKGVTETNSRRLLLCSDDRQPKTMFEEGHIDNHLRICVKEGIDPVTAIRMATLNTAEAFRMYDRGAIAPGYRADITLFEDLKDFRASKVWISGEIVAEDGEYLPEMKKYDISSVRGSVHVADFHTDRLKVQLKSQKVNVIGILPGGVVSERRIEEIKTDADGDFVFDPAKDVCKVAVIERHHNTGKLAVGFLGGYGIKEGAIAVTVAHDSHNIIAAGVSNEEIAFAVESLIDLEGGMVVVKNGKVLASMPLPIAGLMSNESGEWVEEHLSLIHETAYRELSVSKDVEPVMTLTFMSLPVIPEIKLTDRGLFDYGSFSYIPLEAE